MRSRGVPILKLGSRGPGGDARSLRLCSQAFASVRNRSQASAECRTCVGLASDTKIVAKRRTVVTFYVSHYKSVNSHRDRGGVVVAKRRTVAFGLVSGLRVSKVSTVTGIGGSWSRNADLSSFLDLSCVFASQKCRRSQGSGEVVSRNAELSSLLDSSCVFASQKCQRSQGSGGSWSRNPDLELSSLLDSSCVFASQKCQRSQGSGGSWSRNPDLS